MHLDWKELPTHNFRAITLLLLVCRTTKQSTLFSPHKEITTKALSTMSTPDH